MAQVIKQANILGRIGSGLGQGLSEQLPREMEKYNKEQERQRLAQGLEELSQKQDLSPFQQFAALSAIPGITPQQIESGSRILEKQGRRKSFLGSEGENENSSTGRDIPVPQDQRKQLPQEPGLQRRYGEPVTQNDQFGRPEINPENPLDEKFTPRARWTPQRNQQEIRDILRKNPYYSIEEATAQAKDNEARYLAMPAAEREIYDHKEKIKDAIENKYEKKLAEKLEKKAGEPGDRPLYKDISGELKERVGRNIEAELNSNPNANSSEVVDNWTDKLLNFAKTKDQLRTLGASGTIDKFTKSSDIRTKLEGYSRDFAELGAQDELYSILIKLDEKGNGFGLSPENAAYFAYPRSPQADNQVNEVLAKEKNNIFQGRQNTNKIVSDVVKNMTSEDNPLAIAKYMKDQNPYFDTTAFFEELLMPENYNKLNPMQQRGAKQGIKDFTPTWGDIGVMPIFKRGKLK